jgi:anti-sigma factor RsiW
MDCNEARKRLPLSIDGELDAAGQQELDAHLAQCAGCRRQHAQLRSVAEAVRTTASYHRAPPSLRDRIEAALPGARRRPPERAARRAFGWPSFGLASLAAAGAAAVTLLVVLAQRPSLEQRIDEEAVASHARALISEHAIDVASSDRHTVKPWFSGKLDFAPPVRDLAAEGFALAGGRLDYVDGRRVAALVFRHGPHLIDVFVWPAGPGESAPVRIDTLQGFQVAAWSADGMTFRAVSDVDAAELRRLADLLRSPAPG